MRQPVSWHTCTQIYLERNVEKNPRLSRTGSAQQCRKSNVSVYRPQSVRSDRRRFVCRSIASLIIGRVSVRGLKPRQSNTGNRINVVHTLWQPKTLPGRPGIIRTNHLPAPRDTKRAVFVGLLCGSSHNHVFSRYAMINASRGLCDINTTIEGACFTESSL